MAWGEQCFYCGRDDCSWVRGELCEGRLADSLATISVLVEGLHAQIFGVHSLGDPALSHAALDDGGQIHEAVHALVRSLPGSTPKLAGAMSAKSEADQGEVE